MAAADDPRPFEVTAGADGAVRLAGEAAGEGPAIVCLHGLTATRRYVLQGSRHLDRRGYAVIAYDARGHGASSPAEDPAAYEYRHLVADLAAVLDGRGLERAVVVGSSMGATTAAAFALAEPERVAALVLVTPAYAGRPEDDPEELERWAALAAGLRAGGVEGFLRAYDPRVDERWRETVIAFTRQRLERHEHPGAVADAIDVVPRSMAFDGLEALERVEAPTLVIASRDEPDPSHPLRVAEAYAERLSSAEVAVEREGESPLAWQGARLSRRIGDFLERAL